MNQSVKENNSKFIINSPENIKGMTVEIKDNVLKINNTKINMEKIYNSYEKVLDNNYTIKINESSLQADISNYYYLDDIYEATSLKNEMVYKIVYQIECSYAKYLKLENSQETLDLLDKVQIVDKVDKLFKEILQDNSELSNINKITAQINIAKKEILNKELEFEYSRLVENFSILDEDKTLKDKIYNAKNIYLSVINETEYNEELLNSLNSVFLDKKYNELNGKDKYIESSEYRDIVSQINLASFYIQSNDPNDILGKMSEKIDLIYDTFTKQKEDIYINDGVEAVRYYIKNKNQEVYKYLGNKVYEENLVELLQEEKENISPILANENSDFDTFYSNVKSEFMKVNEIRDEKQQEYIASLMETYNDLTFKEKENFFRFSFENEEIALDVLKELEDRKNKLKEIQLSFDSFSNVLHIDVDSLNKVKECIEKNVDKANEIVKKDFENMLVNNNFLSPLIDNCIEGENPLKNLNSLSSEARKQLMMTSNYNEKIKDIQERLLQKIMPDITKCGESILQIAKYGSQKEIENAIEKINENKDILEITFFYIKKQKEDKFNILNNIEPYINNRQMYYDFLNLYDLLATIEIYQIKDVFNLTDVDMQRSNNIWLDNLVNILDKEEIRKAELNRNQKIINNRQLFETNKNIYSLKKNINKGEDKLKDKFES